jgi:hypothetical protein
MANCVQVESARDRLQMAAVFGPLVGSHPFVCRHECAI